MTEEGTLLDVGVVTKAHGLRGEVIVTSWTDLPSRFAGGSVLQSARGPLTVVTAKPHSGALRVQFDGVQTRDDAERLRGTVLQAEPVASDDVVFIHELIGATVRTVTGEDLGTVKAVEANPASDLLVTTSGHLIPMVFVTEHVPGAAISVDVPDGLLDL